MEKTSEIGSLSENSLKSKTYTELVEVSKAIASCKVNVGVVANGLTWR